MAPDIEQGLHQTKVNSSRWWKIREPVAELLGVCVLIIFGTGVDCQAVLSTNSNVASSPRGGYISINFGWAIGTAMGVWVAGGISGAHINPAVTLTMAVFREFPWRKVPTYILFQLLGGILGAAVTYANYYHAIDVFEGPGNRTLKTAGLFATYALDYMTNVSAFFDEFLGTAVLVVVVLAINDKKNNPPPSGLAPLVLFLLVLGIGASIGMQTGYAINPARDLGPRILTAMVGYGAEVFTYRNHYWIWCPVMGPLLGGLFGACIYDGFLYMGDDNIFARYTQSTTIKYTRGMAQKISYINRDGLAALMKSDKKAQKDFVVVDVRDEDYVGGNIKGAINEPSRKFLKNVDRLVRQTKEVPLVIFHCALSQVRGPKAAGIYADTRKNILQGNDIKYEVAILQDGFTEFQVKYRHDPELVENWDKDHWEPDWGFGPQK